MTVKWIHISTAQPIARSYHGLSKSRTNFRVENLPAMKKLVIALNVIVLDCSIREKNTCAFFDIVRSDVGRSQVVIRIDKVRGNFYCRLEPCPLPALRDVERYLPIEFEIEFEITPFSLTGFKPR